MVDFFSVLDWIAALLFGGALGMTALGTKELNAARLMIWAALVISILRWTMWAFASDQPWYVRALVGGALGAFLLAAIPAALHWIAAKQPAVSPNESQSAPAPTPPPTTTSPPADFHPGTIAHIRSYANGGGAIRIEGDLSKTTVDDILSWNNGDGSIDIRNTPPAWPKQLGPIELLGPGPDFKNADDTYSSEFHFAVSNKLASLAVTVRGKSLLDLNILQNGKNVAGSLSRGKDSLTKMIAAPSGNYTIRIKKRNGIERIPIGFGTP